MGEDTKKKVVITNTDISIGEHIYHYGGYCFEEALFNSVWFFAVKLAEEKVLEKVKKSLNGTYDHQS